MGKLLFVLLLSLSAHAGYLDLGPVQDLLGHAEVDLYDSTGAQRGTTGNPIYTGRTWTLSSTDLVSAVQSGTWNINNVSGTISLPTGASTATLQSTGNGYLSSITGQLPSSLGSKTLANSLSVGIASDQVSTLSTSALQTSGNSSLSTIATNSGTQSTAALQTTGNNSLATIATNSGTEATSALQTTGNGYLSNIQTNTYNTQFYLSNLTSLATAANQSTQNSYLSQIATNTASALTDNTMTGSINAVNGTVVMPAQGVYTASIGISGTFVATLVVEGQLADTAGTWVQVPSYVVTNTLPYQPTFTISSPMTVLNTGGGFLNIRVRASSYTSGTINVGLDGSLAQQTVFSAQLGPWTMGRTWTLSPSTDQIGTAPVDGTKASYSAAVTNIAIPSSGTTDVFTITGSNSKVIRITRIGFTGAQSTTGQRDVALIKRSSVDTGGTATSVTVVPLDSTNAAGTATVAYYTANPTLGTTVGMVRSARLLFASAGADSDNYSWDFGTRPAQAIVLRGNTQQLVINLNAISSGGTILSVNIEWTEE